MPWASKSQAKWGNSPAGLKALKGRANVDEWNQSTDFSSLPEKAPGEGKPPQTGALLRALKRRKEGLSG